jgi:hypothetical protein
MTIYSLAHPWSINRLEPTILHASAPKWTTVVAYCGLYPRSICHSVNCLDSRIGPWKRVQTKMPTTIIGTMPYLSEDHVLNLESTITQPQNHVSQ